MAFEYHDPAQIQRLGEQIRDKAIQVTMDQAASYAAAQQAAVNDANRSDTGWQTTRVSNYTTPATGRPDDQANLQAYVGSAYAGIPALFAAFALPNPDNCRPMIDTLHSVAAAVQVDLSLSADGQSVAVPTATDALAGTAPVGQVTDAIKSHMKGWFGEASRAFEGYLSDNVTAADLQRAFVNSLALGLEVQLEINRRINSSIWEIGQKTLKALDGLDAWCPGANASNTQALLTVGGAVAAVAAVAIGGIAAGAGTAEVLSLTGVEAWQSLATILSSSSSLQTQTVAIGGLTVPPIITGLQNAINLLTHTIDDTDRQLADGLQKYTTIIHTNWNNIVFRIPDDYTRLTDADSTTLQTPGGMYTQ